MVLLFRLLHLKLPNSNLPIFFVFNCSRVFALEKHIGHFLNHLTHRKTINTYRGTRLTWVQNLNFRYQIHSRMSFYSTNIGSELCSNRHVKHGWNEWRLMKNKVLFLGLQNVTLAAPLNKCAHVHSVELSSCQFRTVVWWEISEGLLTFSNSWLVRRLIIPETIYYATARCF